MHKHTCRPKRRPSGQARPSFLSYFLLRTLDCIFQVRLLGQSDRAKVISQMWTETKQVEEKKDSKRNKNNHNIKKKKPGQEKPTHESYKAPLQSFQPCFKILKPRKIKTGREAVGRCTPRMCQLIITTATCGKWQKLNKLMWACSLSFCFFFSPYWRVVGGGVGGEGGLSLLKGWCH